MWRSDLLIFRHRKFIQPNDSQSFPSSLDFLLLFGKYFRLKLKIIQHISVSSVPRWILRSATTDCSSLFDIHLSTIRHKYNKYILITFRKNMPDKNQHLIIIAIFSFLAVFASCQGSLTFRNYSHIFGDSPNSFELFENSPIYVDGQEYTGIYNRLQDQMLFNYLESSSGDINALFFTNPFDSSKSYQLNSLEIFLFDPVYRDGRAIGILIPLDSINGTEWDRTDQNVTIATFDKEKSDSQEIMMHVDYTITLQHYDNKDPKEVTVSIKMSGEGFKFKAELHYDNTILSTMGYCLYVSGMVALQIAAAFMMLRNMEANAHFFSKMSLMTVSICNIEDFYLTMVHIEYIMEANNSYLFFILPALSYTLLFVIFDMKLLFLVWRGHYMRDIVDPQELRKKLTFFYIQFYVGLFAYLTLSYFFSYYEWLIIAQNFFILPQIIHNARVGNSPGFSPFYILGYLGLRFYLPFYQRACPLNHFLLTPMPVVVTIIGLLFVVMILWLYFQHVFGPRFFIPKFLQPNYFGYDCKLKMTEQNSTLQCTICIQGIFEDPDKINDGALNSSQVGVAMLKEVTVMKTPCSHYFHKDCLTRWIDVKMECPTCRKVLPPV